MAHAEEETAFDVLPITESRLRSVCVSEFVSVGVGVGAYLAHAEEETAFDVLPILTESRLRSVSLSLWVWVWVWVWVYGCVLYACLKQ